MNMNKTMTILFYSAVAIITPAIAAFGLVAVLKVCGALVLASLLAAIVGAGIELTIPNKED
jgi:hypothetical protein